MQQAQGFIVNSDHLYKIATDGYLRAKKGAENQRQNDAFVSVVFSALALEAFINELLSLVKDAKQGGSNEDFLDRLIDSIDESKSNKKSTCMKFMLASEALNNGFKKGENPYQDFADLFRLRDCLFHLKPEDRFEMGDNGEMKYFERDMIKRLRSKNIILKDTSVVAITLLISTAKAAYWACDTASSMVNAILNKIPQSEYIQGNETLTSYRSTFQSPTL
jgi:hypothetical protein